MNDNYEISSDWNTNASPSIDNSMGKCDKCESSAKIRSILNGEIKYQLCRECYLKVGRRKPTIKNKRVK